MELKKSTNISIKTQNEGTNNKNKIKIDVINHSLSLKNMFITGEKVNKQKQKH